MNKFSISLLDNYKKIKYYINNNFFNFFLIKGTKEDYLNPKINIIVIKKNHNNNFILKFYFKGVITLICDITSNKYLFKINKKKTINIIFSKDIYEETDNYLILPFNTRKINIAQYIYDSIILMLPFKKIDPKIKNKIYGTSKKKDKFI